MPPLVAVDIFDPDPQVVDRVIARHAAALRAIQLDYSQAKIDALVAAIRADGDHAYVSPSLVTYYEHDGERAYLTIDLVERRDAARRVAFRPEPTGSYADPDGLLATWEAYDATIHQLLRAGETLPPPARCASFHCLGDPAHPALHANAERMTARVPAHVDELATILRDDHRFAHRAAAAYLLAYAPDGARVVASLLPAMRDPHLLVRNNAIRVLAEIARTHPQVDVPIAPILEALSFPESTDRNKASATLLFLLRRPGAAPLYPRVRQQAGPILLALLRLTQPNNHDFAYKILKQISGQSYGERDYAAWQSWLSRTR